MELTIKLSSSDDTAVGRFFLTNELVEQTFLVNSIQPGQLKKLQHVNKKFNIIIVETPSLQRKMFKKPQIAEEAEKNDATTLNTSFIPGNFGSEPFPTHFGTKARFATHAIEGRIFEMHWATQEEGFHSYPVLCIEIKTQAATPKSTTSTTNSRRRKFTPKPTTMMKNSTLQCVFSNIGVGLIAVIKSLSDEQKLTKMWVPGHANVGAVLNAVAMWDGGEFEETAGDHLYVDGNLTMSEDAESSLE